MIKMLKMGVLLSILMAFSYDQKLKPSDSLVNTCNVDNKTFQAGEEITYKLYYNWNFIWLPAGEVVFRVNDKGNEYQISADGRTYPSYEWFFKVRDYYECHIDKKTLLPKLSIREVQEGKFRLYDKLQFNHEKGEVISHRGKSKEEAKSSVYRIEGCMHDILSIIYFTRNLNFHEFEPEEEFPVNIFMDKETWPLQVKYLGRVANKKVKGVGRYNTIKFSPEVIYGDIFKEGSQMEVYVSDDENRIPLLIESPVSVGSVKAVIKEYKGLKYDLSSKIK